jgi:thiol-disulfide isomerase/thioredoxin
MLEFGEEFHKGLFYEDFLDRYATPEQRTRWEAVFNRIVLTDAQKTLLGSFKREMKVLVLAGTWCGDCVEQCPIFAHFAEATDRIGLRFFDRDDQPVMAKALQICGAARVPAVMFLSEDDFPCGRSGDRTLSKYRRMAADLTGAACPTGLGRDDQLTAAVLQEWLDEFERIQLMLRTSGRLRQKHGD